MCISSVITALNFLHISDQWFLLLKMGVHFGTKLERKNLFPMRYLSQWKSKDPHTNSAHRPSVSQRYHTGSIFAEKWVYDNDKNSKVFIKTFGSHFTLKNLIENIPKIQLCSTWFKTPLFSPPCHFIKSDESSPSTNHKCIYYFPKYWFSVHHQALCCVCTETKQFNIKFYLALYSRIIIICLNCIVNRH